CEVLTGEDSIGVIAFDDTAMWVVPMQPVGDVSAIQSKIGTIRPGGGTAYYGALNAAYQALASSDAAQKHVIFLSDGAPGDGGFHSIASSMAQRGITLTTVGVGTGANAQLLGELAALGEGRAYMAGEFDSLPKIFTKETYMASGKYVQNRAFTPAVTADNAMTDFIGFPQLTGYLSTTAKPLAALSLVSDTDEPVLADWRYGAGRVACWTSDAAGAWSDAFLRWDQAAAFFGGLVSAVLPNAERQGQLIAAIDDGRLTLTYRAEGDATGEAFVADVLTPAGDTAAVALGETAPGVYAATLPAADEGAYAVAIGRGDGSAPIAEGGAVAVWPAEYDLRLRAEEGTLAALAQATGGRIVTDAAQLLAERSQPTRTRVDLTAALMAAALLLFLADVALNRLPWERALASARAAAARPARPAKTARANAPPPTGQPDTASQLLAARKTRKRL
ncbi:MAG: VWA domain-containing protein, partial [Clostridiales bacterium]|nr:VWA domain-containing protein [Clostridiales bacterium]